jgi:ADP-dependent phosphofructokinase/glucokinase
MTAAPATDWAGEYAALARRLPQLARSARLTLCAFSACIDRLFDLHELAPRLLAHADPRAVAFGLELRRRAAAGIGGEICVDWPDGPAWLEPQARLSRLGGTAAQAAQALALLDAPALLALADRGPAQLALIDGRVLVAEAGGVVPLAACATGAASGKLPHFIFEYTEGRDVAGATPPRSTRVIVRFAEEDIDDDPGFAALSVALAAGAGAGIVDGFNELAPERFAAAAARAMAVVDRWRAAGLDVVHAELGDYSEPRHRQATLAVLRGRVSSIGMNRRELNVLVRHEAPPDAQALAVAGDLRVDRVCIHADDWALSVTRGDPRQERLALMVGCLLAATRAGQGVPAVPTAPPAGARYASPPAPTITAKGWHVVTCASPCLARPRSTIGLGDTFLAGTMLVLGQNQHVGRISSCAIRHWSRRQGAADDASLIRPTLACLRAHRGRISSIGDT